MVFRCVYWQPPDNAIDDHDADRTVPVGAGLPASTLSLGLRGFEIRKPGADSRFDMFFNICVGRPYFRTLTTHLLGQVDPSFGYFAGFLLVADAATHLEPAILMYPDRLTGWQR